jgi:glycosyltransferase involved in cell wall biosynthesis
LLRLPTGIFSQVVVADNGSTDETARVAREAGARVVSIAERGYGAACLAVLDEAPDDVVLVYMQADGSEDAREAEALVAPIFRGEADVVIGSRVMGVAAQGALRPHQVFGNWLATTLLWCSGDKGRRIWGRFARCGRECYARLAWRTATMGGRWKCR